MQMNIQFQNDIFEDSDSELSVLDFERRDFSTVSTQTGSNICQSDFVFTQTVIIPTCDKCCQTCELQEYQQLNYQYKKNDDTQLQIQDQIQIQIMDQIQIQIMDQSVKQNSRDYESQSINSHVSFAIPTLNQQYLDDYEKLDDYELNNALKTSIDRMKSIKFETQTNGAKMLKYNKYLHSQTKKSIMQQRISEMGNDENNKYEEDYKQRIQQFKEQDLNYDQIITTINTKFIKIITK
ncbi:Hypothetical_protein [Hexamita inflata]|uniref:Hypothetical_protein n=1 Tax=Hexamita inflata TaxID=28002 RepID=A0AA86ULC2_9EUKA|nr:Hypothetical protein HINF_LOCUS50370 [Hexamita inflata]